MSARQTTWSDYARAVRAKIERDLDEERGRSARLRESVQPRVEAAVAQARLDRLCSAAWLFGSFAWGEPVERSDVDVLVEGCRDPDGLAAVIAEACGREVHVVRRETAPESLVRRALAEGRRL